MPTPLETRRAEVRWRLHLASPPARVFAMLASDEGRTRFWAESAVERDGAIAFEFPDGTRWRGRIFEHRSPRRFGVEYLGASRVRFELEPDGHGGTDLLLRDEGVPREHREETLSGWVSVLMSLKAAVDHGVDLRNHDPRRTWSQGYVDN